MLKGKDEKVTVYRVVGRVERAAQEKRSELTEIRAKGLVAANKTDS
jgi:hypothetical protein